MCTKHCEAVLLLIFLITVNITTSFADDYFTLINTSNGHIIQGTKNTTNNIVHPGSILEYQFGNNSNEHFLIEDECRNFMRLLTQETATSQNANVRPYPNLSTLLLKNNMSTAQNIYTPTFFSINEVTNQKVLIETIEHIIARNMFIVKGLLNSKEITVTIYSACPKTSNPLKIGAYSPI